MFNVVALNNQEEILEFIDPDLISITENMETQGLRTISVEYNIQQLENANRLFQMGNKLYVTGDNIEDCLYVLNTPVKKDLLDNNVFTFEAEEVLVELNYAPLFKQTDLTRANGFNITTVNNEPAVIVDYNALDYWFGDYFNIGIVQACLSDYVAKISLSGTMTLMSLLRYIEEETGNIFVARYEKDILTNTIHRYLDFLNPISQNKNWELNLAYDFLEPGSLNPEVFDENDVPTTEDEEDETDDPAEFQPNIPVQNINPENILFRCTKNGEVLTSDNDEPLEWNNLDVGFTDNTKNVVIQLKYNNNKLGVSINGKTFTSNTGNVGGDVHGYIDTWADTVDINDVILPNGSYFEIYDYVHEKVLFSKKIHAILSDVHSDVLDLGYNVGNIEIEIDETDTYTAISPVLSGDNDQFSRTDMNTIIQSWINLEVEKGAPIPMIVEKITITGTEEKPCVARIGEATSTTTTAAALLGAKVIGSNYWKKPLHGNDNIEQTNRSYEYWRGTAYWKAPFSKHAGDMHISIDNDTGAEYTHICCRPDYVDERANLSYYEKMGTVETSAEDVYAIYNAVAMKLKEKKDPQINLDVDVANLRNGLYNNYNVYDKVYIKLPGSNDLITARVEKTEKDPHDITENKITLSNYNINPKASPKETYIDASNANFKYPKTKPLTATLKNAEYTEGDTNSSEVISNKLVTFTVYNVENGSASLTGKVYTKTTNKNGIATITMNYDPGDYEIDISFGGDEEYSECSLTVEVNVSGVKEVPKTVTTTNTKAKTVKKNTKTKKVKTYYTKCGVSPDKKTIVAIAQPSASNSDMRKHNVNYHTIYKTVFKNKCPYCGKATLRYDDGRKNGCITNHGHSGNKREVPEGEITCHNCDSDFDGVTGLEKSNRHTGRLTVVKKPVKSSKTEKNKLIKGKLQYGTKTVKVKTKTKTTKKTYSSHASGINSKVKKKAISIASGTHGITALKKIAAYMGSKIHYGYSTGFTKTPIQVLNSGKGNCCSQTRLMLQMMDVVDTENQFKLEYVHVCCGPKGVGHVFAKVTTKKSGKWRYVDPCKSTPWGHYVHGWGSPPGSRSTYPNRPF